MYNGFPVFQLSIFYVLWYKAFFKVAWHHFPTFNRFKYKASANLFLYSNILFSSAWSTVFIYCTVSSCLGLSSFHINNQCKTSSRGAGVLPEKLGRCIRSAFQNPYPTYDPYLRFSLLYLWPDQIFHTLFSVMAGLFDHYPVSDLPCNYFPSSVQC